jgi:predicted P-loop ATPase
LTLSRHFRFKPAKDLLRTALSDAARVNSFHPVRDYLAGLQWDGVKRIDTWLSEYGGAEDTEYTRAVGALMLIAAVRRVRIPGCKFDEMVVLENEQQGTNKSSTLATLAVRDDWFSDDLPLYIRGKEIVESLRGRWIIEAAELSGMRRADIEHLKAFLSRQTDRARMVYDRIVTEVDAGAPGAAAPHWIGVKIEGFDLITVLSDGTLGPRISLKQMFEEFVMGMART